MCDSVKVLSYANGNLKPKIMFIGEAPGRLGADDTGIPFHGDKAGFNFEDLLRAVGLHRSEIFVTNALLCNPKDENGNNTTPSITEISNCTEFLKRQIDIINPPYVATLGAVALQATRLIERHELELSKVVRTEVDWYGRKLVPLYHPGQRAMLHRSFANQRSDYQFLIEQVRRRGKSPSVQGRPTNAEIATIVELILRRLGSVSYFALHKLFYLIEVRASVKLGTTLTSAYFIRQKDGPYCTDLHYKRLLKALPTLKARQISGKLFLNSGGTPSLFDSPLPDQVMQIIDDVLEKYSTYTDAQLKTAVYLSAPMRRVLRAEQESNQAFYYTPLNINGMAE